MKTMVFLLITLSLCFSYEVHLGREYESIGDNGSHLLLREDGRFFYYDRYSESDGNWYVSKQSEVYTLNSIICDGRDIRQVAAGYFAFDSVEVSTIDAQRIVLWYDNSHKDTLVLTDGYSEYMRDLMEREW